MKFFSNLHQTKWSIHIIPNIDLYLETSNPLCHGFDIKDGFVGYYITLKWIIWEYTIGFFKSLK